MYLHRHLWDIMEWPVVSEYRWPLTQVSHVSKLKIVHGSGMFGSSIRIMPFFKKRGGGL